MTTKGELYNEETNLIDLKDDGIDLTYGVNTENDYDGDEDDEEEDGSKKFDFSELKFIEKPNGSGESVDTMLPQTLEDCVGYLQQLPLFHPNTDAKKPITIVNMVNILSIPESESILEAAASGASQVSDIYSNYHSEPMASLLKSAKGMTKHQKAPFNLGHTVRPGCISMYSRYGVVYAVPEGRWWLPDTMSKWISKNISLDQDVIMSPTKQVLIIRIIEGEIGLITVQGEHRLLDVGTHVFNSGTVQYFGKVEYASKNYYSHGPYHYMNVPRGKYAKVWAEVTSPETGIKSLVPRLIKEGEHFIKSTFFKYMGLVDVSDEYIEHGSTHILNVEKGRIAKIFQENLPRLLGEGLHIIESPNFSYQATELISPDNLCIEHGTITILQVPRGKIALAWNCNEPYFFDQPGLYEFNSNNFHFVEFVEASERKIELGSKKVIQVYTGEVGITYDKGNLKILHNGRHVIDSSTHVFERFLSTKQRSIRLVTYSANHKIAKSTFAKNDGSKWKMHEIDEDADYLICETKDLVKVGIRADVFYSIANPEKCIQSLDTDELEDLVRETSLATLTNIIRSEALNQIAQSRQITASSEPETVITATAVTEENEDEFLTESQIQQEATSGYFFDRAHDEFMSKLHEDFVTRYGVDIANIRIESLKIMDTELASEIAQNCLTTAHVENQLANLQGQNLIATQKEQTASDCLNINAGAQAKALKTSSDAENKRKIDASKAEAESLKIKAMAKAQAEADAILLTAKAEAEAIRLKAVAEAERAKLLSQTALGQQQSLFELYADMVKTSNQGVSKVVYMDPSVNPNSSSSPFTLGSLDGLNRDLHSLSKLGIMLDNHDSADDQTQNTQNTACSAGKQ